MPISQPSQFDNNSSSFNKNDHPIQAYVHSLGGKRSIRKVLIANNGIAAVKAIRSIRRWSYETFGNERTVLFVSMATPEDISANAEYVRMADIFASVPGGSNNHNFANVDLICDVAQRFKCDAVWAGWGHASENPLLPSKLSQFGITFLGPNPKSMHALGDKIASTIIAQSANVPTVAWSGSGLTVNYRATNSIPDQVYQQARVTSADHAKRVAEQCGYPLVVKASEGGGGKGIRVVFEEHAICAAYRQVACEVPGSPIFLMKLVQNARHLEVQVVADETGDAIALYGRDCSVQRRHQKIIEEGPAVAAPSHVWKRLEQAAIALAKEVGYVGAGTVEYLYKGDKENGQFYFLELNPRLQVEHPVTEWITGVNLPALQLHIGMGIPLRNVPTIRKFLRLPSESMPISNISSSPPQAISSDISSVEENCNGHNLDKVEHEMQNPIPPHGHVIACRVTAENPDEGFQPTSGAIQELTFRNTPNVWGYFSVGASGGVHEFADSQFGHLFAWGEDRESSRRCLVLALKELSIRGDIRTTVEYLIKLLEMEAFRENHIDTGWLDSLIADKVVAEKPPKDLAVIVGSVCRAHMSFTEKADSFTKCLERGQLPPMDNSLVDFPIQLIYEDIKYCFRITRSDVSSFRVRITSSNLRTAKIDGDSILVEVRTLADGARLVMIDGRSHVCYAREEPAGLRLSIDGKTCIFPKEYDPTSLTSSVSGKLIRFLVENGDHVEKGQPFVELEVMKMYLTLSAPESGKITIIATESSSVEIGDKIATLELDDPSKVRKAEKFTGNLPSFEEPQACGEKPHQRFNRAKKDLQLLLRGFDTSHSCVEDFINAIDDAQVCAGELREILSALSGRIPANLSEKIDAELKVMCKEAGVTNSEDQVSTRHTNAAIRSLSSDAREKAIWKRHVKAISSSVTKILALCHSVPEAAELTSLATKYSTGSVLTSTVTMLLDQYLTVEKQFARRNGSAGDALFALRDENKKDLSAVAEVAASHVRLKEKNHSLILFLEVLKQPVSMSVLAEDNAQTAEFKARLHQLSQLYAPNYADIALRARLFLADLRRPHFDQRKSSVGRLLENISTSPPSMQEKEIRSVVGISEPIMDLLVSFILSEAESVASLALRKIAVHIHLLRSYRAYEVRDLKVSIDEESQSNSPLTATWQFRFNKRDSEVNGLSKVLGSQETSLKPQARGMISFDSADNLSNAPGASTDSFEEEPFRRGALATFDSWASLESGFDDVLIENANSLASVSHREVNVLTILFRWDMSTPRSKATSGVHGLKRTKSNELNENFRDPFAAETIVSQSLSDFCRAKPSRQELAKRAGLKSITFIVANSASNESATYPGFYTFRVRDNFQEDPIYRHIDPPMAFQLELSRLSNFSITRFGYPNRSLHVFFAQDKARTSKLKPAESSPKSAQRPPLAGSSGKGKELANNENKKLLSDTAKSPSISNPSSGKQSNVQGESRKATGGTDRDIDARFFVRAVIRQADVFSTSADGAIISMPEAERIFVEALDAIDMASCDRRFRRTDFNHMFLNVIPPVHIDIEDVETICRRMFQRYANRCWSLRVFAVEIKVPALVSDEAGGSSVIPLRFLLFNPTGHMLRVESYVESTDPNTGVEKLLSVSQDNPGSLHGTQVSEPYRVMDRIQRRRVMAQAMETTYVYDFLHIFARQLQQLWRRYSEDRLLGGFHRHKIPLNMMEATELILEPGSPNNDPQLISTKRGPGLNDIGMVVWKCIFKTPEYPTGREVILIANDITFRSGSFGPEEDVLFCAASRMARENGIPRIYLAANSGARIGLAEEIRDKLQVAWIDRDVPGKGFSGICIKEDDLQAVSRYVKTGEKMKDATIKITDIIGAEHGIGVENLMGSGLIAGETSRAYDETFTLTYVSARSVGIGAYLVRLGQRVIQKESAAPIILTGFSALNKVLGHEVYMSNEQLGGTKVMHPNGITHIVVKDDIGGVGEILTWLSYVPKARGELLPIVESRDPVSRPILVKPPSGGQPYDPRKSLIGGEIDPNNGRQFLSGLFDKDSWKEYLEGWAKTVVVGRARLGGVPTGVVSVETRSVERVTPADPASPETRESVVTQAGQVWYPDSAAKTAQAIRDFDREGLPLFILANWRGFSGGMRDMYDEVLKSGSLIVDALRDYHQPVFVYIPPGGEVRGGAWVVLDTLINPEMIEMYADGSSRGGVLEPEGTVDVKYRRRHLIKTMHRLDSKLNELDKELAGGKESSVLLSDERKQSIYEAIYAREAEILPVYRNVATSFCDLHDTPGRLLEKGAIRDIIDWEEARSFFYWRLQRRLAEDGVRKKCEKADPSLSTEKITSLLKRWAADYRAETGVNGHNDADITVDTSHGNLNGTFDKDDRWVFQWLEVEEDTIQKRIDRIRTARIATKVSESCSESKEGFLDGIEGALRGCKSNEERAALVSAIQQKIGLVSSTGSTTLSSSFNILGRLGKFGWDRDHV